MLLLSACGQPGRMSTGMTPGNSTPGGGTPGQGGPIDVGGEAKPCQKMDILFVIDNSGSMAEEQSNLASNLPMFIDVLNQFSTSAGDQLDWRAAIATTGRDLTYNVTFPPPFNITMPLSEHGENGVFQTGSSCGMVRKWVERNDADPKTEFACAAKLGTSGSGIEMPLYATKLALGDRVSDGTNAGFLRDDALLAVVILTDENDCSREDNNFTCDVASGCPCDPAQLKSPQTYADFLDQVKGGAGRWAVATVAGPGPGTCSSSFGDAEEATRLKDFVGLAGQNGVFSSICDGDLTKSLTDALNTFQSACEHFPPVQ